MNFDGLLKLLEKIENDIDCLMDIYMAIGAENMTDIIAYRNAGKVKFSTTDRSRVLTAVNLFEVINKGFILEMDSIAGVVDSKTFDFIMDTLCNDSDKMYYAIKMIIDKNTKFTCFTKKAIEWANDYIYTVATENINHITNAMMGIRGFERRLIEAMNKGTINPKEYIDLRQRMEIITRIKLCVLEKYS